MKTLVRRNLRHKTIRLIATAMLSLVSVCVASAQELEYNMELGGMVGGNFYMGDANNTSLFGSGSLAGGVLARYNINPRMAVKGNLAVGRLQGTTVGQANKFPGGEHSAFSRTIYELGAQYECHFFAYGTGQGYKDSRRIAPYMLGGVGITYAPKPANHVFALSIPVGFGVKYKFAERINMGAEWTMRFTTADRLDVTNTSGLALDDPYGIHSKGMKNKDCYSWLMLYVSYDMFPKYRKCNN